MNHVQRSQTASWRCPRWPWSSAAAPARARATRSSPGAMESSAPTVASRSSSGRSVPSPAISLSMIGLEAALGPRSPPPWWLRAPQQDPDRRAPDAGGYARPVVSSRLRQPSSSRGCSRATPPIPARSGAWRCCSPGRVSPRRGPLRLARNPSCCCTRHGKDRRTAGGRALARTSSPRIQTGPIIGPPWSRLPP